MPKFNLRNLRDIIGIGKESAFETFFRNEINRGIFEPGSRLPNPVRLSVYYKVPVPNVMLALRKLEKEGLLITYPGKGTFVMRKGHIRPSERLIGVICSGSSALTAHRTIAGIERIVTANGYGMMLKYTRDSQAREERVLKEMLNAGVEGVIIEPSQSQIMCKHMSLYRQMEEKEIPYVFMRSAYPQLIDRPRIMMDDRQGAYLITRHLIATGREHIVGLFKTDDAVGAERHRGYVQALQEAGIYYNPELVIWFHSEDTVKKPEVALSQLEKEEIRFDAIQCYNDSMAAGVREYLTKNGKTVPGDVAVTGYDNSAVTPAGEIGLTTIVEPLELLGEMTAQLLLEQIAQVPDTESQVEKLLHPELIIRGSTIGTNI